MFNYATKILFGAQALLQRSLPGL